MKGYGQPPAVQQPPGYGGGNSGGNSGFNAMAAGAFGGNEQMANMAGNYAAKLGCVLVLHHGLCCAFVHGVRHHSS